MDNSSQSQGNIFGQYSQQNLPNATAVLVLGIVSIAVCFCYGVFGLICGIIALVLAKKDTALYLSMPGQYTPASFQNIKAGKICSIIGLILSGLCLLIFVFYFVIIGTAALSDPSFFKHLK